MDKISPEALPQATAGSATTVQPVDQTFRMNGRSRDIANQPPKDALFQDGRDFSTSIFHSLPQHIAVLDEHGVIIAVNQAWEDFARDNHAPGHLLKSVGTNYLDICKSASAYDFGAEALVAMAGIQAVLAGHQTEFSLEYPCHSPSEQRWFIMHVTPLRGSFAGGVVVHENITSRKLAELAANESEARFSAFFEHAMLGMATTSPEKGWLLVNPALCAILGYPQEELVKKTWAELTHPDDLAVDVANFERLLRDEADDYVLEKRFIRPSGEIVHTFIAARAIRRADRSIAFFAAIVQEITERKKAEEQIRRAHQLTQQFIDHLPGTAFVKDENLRVLMANQGFQAILGIDPATIIGKKNTEIFPGDFGKKLDEDDRRILENGQAVVLQEEFDGRYFETSKFPMEGESGHQLLGGITVEITERQKYFERQNALLKISELGGTLPETEFIERGLEMLERLTNSQIGFAHFVNDDQETIELLTWTNSTLKGCHAVHDSHYPIKAAGIWADCVRKKQTVVFNDYPGYHAKKGLPDGHFPLQRLISVPIIEEGKVRVILGVGNKKTDYDDYDCMTAQLLGNDLWRIIRRMRAEALLKQNLTELTRLNARLDEINNKLLHTEKLAAIGQLAAGVAHEINNPISYVSSNLNSLLGYMNDLLAISSAYDDVEKRLRASMPDVFSQVQTLKADADYSFIIKDVFHLLDESREGLERVRKIVDDLKSFSRAGATGWQHSCLHDGLESTLNIVWHEIKYKAEIERDYGDLPDVYCIPSQINQVFMNLLTNAAQAIEKHGKIVLRSRQEDQFVWIEVEDDGSGISTEVIDHIFEPFYTTKDVGKGTGLGLSLSWGIVQRHHGKIEVRSTLGRGSTFRVTLPIKPPFDDSLNEIPS